MLFTNLHTAVFIKAVRYICIETFVHKTSILFDTCIAGKQHCLHKNFFRETYLQRISVFMQNFKFGGVTVLAVQLFNKIKRKKKKMKKKKKMYPTRVG